MPFQPESFDRLEEKLAKRELILAAKALDTAGKAASEAAAAAHVDYVPRKREAEKDPIRNAGAKNAEGKNIRTSLPPFGFTTFDTFEAFKEKYFQYLVNNLAKYRTDNSTYAPTWNSKQIERHENRKAAAKAAGGEHTGVLDLIPDHLSYKFCHLKCVHGCGQKPRGDQNKRKQRRTLHTGCQAMITGKATKHPSTGKWYVEVVNENTTHNHPLDEDLFETYMTSSEIADDEVRKQADSMLASGGDMRRMLDILNRGRKFGKFTRRKLTNYREYRLGGGKSVAGFKRLIQAFLSFAGADGLLLKDQNGETIGVIIQTKAQREFVRRYGDSLILDWTHNTNNRGFYLGSLLVTSASGKGVSVLDFLCLTQSKDAMRSVLKHFVAKNPGALEKVRSIVIDKDYKEWSVLEEVFPQSRVVLCQFHVLKWFKHVVNQPKYQISHALRPAVIKILRALVYASTEDDFTHQQFLLADLLAAPTHAPFLQYMDQRWYNCVTMWSNFRRGKIFTATNTTSNRLESYWKQLKDSLGKRQRIDMCLEAIFLYATAVLSRERDLLVEYKSSSPVNAHCHEFIRPLLSDLGEYATRLVVAQWNKFASAPSGAYSVASRQPVLGSRYQVHVRSNRLSVVEVDTMAGTCSCHFARGSNLPCRHLFYAAHAIEKRFVYPPSSLPARWSLSASLVLLPQLHQAVEELSALRLDLTQTIADRGDDSAPTTASTDELVGDVIDESDDVMGEDWALGSSAEGGAIEANNGALGSSAEGGRATEANNGALGSSAEGGRATEANRATNFFQIAEETIRRREVSDCGILNDIEKRNMIETLLQRLTAYLMNQGTARFTMFSVELSELIDELLGKWKTGVEPLAGQDAIDEAEELQEAAAARAAATIGVEDGWHDVARDEEEVVFEEDLPSAMHAPPTNGSTAPSTVSSVFADDYPHPFAPTSEDFAVALSGAALWESSPFEGMDECDVLLQEQDTKKSRAHSLDALLNSDDEGKDEASCFSAHAAPFSTTRQASLKRKVSDAEGKDEVSSLSVQSNLDAAAESFSTTRQASLKRKVSDEEGKDEVSSLSVQSSQEIVEEMTLPDVVRRGHVRDNRQTSSATGRPSRPSPDVQCPVLLEDIVVTLHYTSMKTAVELCAQFPELFAECDLGSRFALVTPEVEGTTYRRFNFTVPKPVLDAVQAALKAKRESNSGVRQTGRYVIHFVGYAKSRYFSESDVQALDLYHVAKSALTKFVTDLEWIGSPSRWKSSGTRLVGSILELGIPVSFDTMREQVTFFLGNACLGQVLSLPELGDDGTETARARALKGCRVPVRQVVGSLAGMVWLNDAVVNFALKMLSNRFEDVVVIDSLNQSRKVVAPLEKLPKVRVVVFPINYDNSHWCVVCVALDWHGGRHQVFLYDPTTTSSWADRLVESWSSWCVRLLDVWRQRDCPNVRSFASVPISSNITPRQTDGYNCGVYCVLQAYSFMTEDHSVLHISTLDAAQAAMVRVRLMWLILCLANSSLDSKKAEQGMRTGSLFSAYYQERLVTAAKPPVKKPKIIIKASTHLGAISL